MSVTPGRAQNWCLDPYGRHEARWFSRGIATALVRDQGIESQDPPPESSFADEFAIVGLHQWRGAGQPSTNPLTASMSIRSRP